MVVTTQVAGMSLTRRSLTVLMLAITLSSCAASVDFPETPVSNMPPAELPTYLPGDHFYFEGGPDYIAHSVENDEITWKLGKKFEFVTNRDFLLPWISWESEKSVSVSETSSDSGALWPLKVGNSERIHREMTFFKDKKNIDRSHKGMTYREERDCEVLGAFSIEVKAGTFDTFKVRCEKYLNRRLYAGTVTYYHSPLVGHFVKKIDTRSGSGMKVMELVSHGISLDGMDDVDQSGLRQHFQQALSTAPTNLVTEWASSDGQQRSSITLTKTFLSEQGEYCRKYAQELAVNGRQRTVHGLACRNRNGTWIRRF